MAANKTEYCKLEQMFVIKILVVEECKLWEICRRIYLYGKAFFCKKKKKKKKKKEGRCL